MRAYSEWGSQKALIDRIEPTHYVRNYLVLKLIKKYSKEHGIKKVCEIGCGTGSLSVELGKLGMKVDASDLDKNAVKLAKKFNHHKNVDYTSRNALELGSSKSYDMAIAIEVIEHIKEDEKALFKISKALKANGLLVVTVPIHEKYRKEFDNRSGHVRRYEPEELIRKIKKAGFDIVYGRHFNFPFLWIWYFFVYLPYSDKKETQMKSSKSPMKKLPGWIWILNIVNKLFLIDLLFDSKRFSTEMLVIAKKVSK